jgi:hypothetical protein
LLLQAMTLDRPDNMVRDGIGEKSQFSNLLNTVLRRLRNSSMRSSGFTTCSRVAQACWTCRVVDYDHDHPRRSLSTRLVQRCPWLLELYSARLLCLLQWDAQERQHATRLIHADVGLSTRIAGPRGRQGSSSVVWKLSYCFGTRIAKGARTRGTISQLDKSRSTTCRFHLTIALTLVI